MKSTNLISSLIIYENFNKDLAEIRINSSDEEFEKIILDLIDQNINIDLNMIFNLCGDISIIKDNKLRYILQLQAQINIITKENNDLLQLIRELQANLVTSNGQISELENRINELEIFVTDLPYKILNVVNKI